MPAPMMIPAADHYWSTLVRQDSEGAYAVVRRMLDLGVPVADALEGIVVHVQQRIGDSWAAGEWTVAQEHAATAISEEVVERVMLDLPPTDPSRRPVLVACAELEFHSLAALVVTASLRSWGWPAEHVGPDVRPEVLRQRVVEVQPEAVLLSASLSSSLPRVARLVDTVAGTGVPVIAGGAAFDAAGVRARRLGASAYAATPAAARALLDGLPESLPHAVVPQPLPLADVVEAEAGRLELMADDLSREVLEQVVGGLDGPSDALAEPEGLDHWSVVLATYTPHLVASIAGGVLTDDPTVPGSAREWLAGVMARRGAPEGVTEQVWSGLRSRLADFPATLAILG
jgi:methanogenic corrinoid protein MtbC1